MKKIAILSAIVISLALLQATRAFAGQINADLEGLTQFIYSWDQEGGNDQLDVSRVQINLTGKPADKVYVFVSVEESGHMSPDAAGARNTIMDGNAEGSIVDAYVDLAYWDKATVRVGQFPLPNSYELNTTPFEQETIQYSQGVGTFSNRDRGIALFADPTPEFSWTGWIVNGGGSFLDDNGFVVTGNSAISGASGSGDDRSDFGTQFDYYPSNSFSIKGWGMWGENASDVSPASDEKYDSFGLGLDYAIHNFHFFSEYNNKNEDIGGTKYYDFTEWYVHVSHKIPGTTVQAVLRYDEYSMDSFNTNVFDRNITTFGLNWDFDKNSRFQIMRDFVDGEDNDKLDAQLSVKF
jgi:hypothetical protein